VVELHLSVPAAQQHPPERARGLKLVSLGPAVSWKDTKVCLNLLEEEAQAAATAAAWV